MLDFKDAVALGLVGTVAVCGGMFAKEAIDKKRAQNSAVLAAAIEASSGKAVKKAVKKLKKQLLKKTP